MDNSPSVKKSMIVSLVLITICFASLIGTTYAWFTDSKSSTNNVIMTGTLDVELYYQLEGQTEWNRVKADTNVFSENAGWQPGRTEVVKLKIVNEGSLALKYKFGVNIVDEVGSKNSQGQDFMLGDYIKFGIIEGEESYTQSEAVAAVNDAALPLSATFAPNMLTLLPKTETENNNEDVVTMVVFMPGNIGNEANPAGGQVVPTISLGINLYATQLVYEDESFNNADAGSACLPEHIGACSIVSIGKDEHAY